MMENVLDKCLSQFEFFKTKKCLESRYVYQNEIGKGAYGYVICGYRRSDHCSVAIKVIPVSKIENWFYSDRLKKSIPMEIVVLAYTHQIYGVISMIEYCEDENLQEWYIIMERCTGAVDLFEFICNGSAGYLYEETACTIFYQLVRTIVELHRLGVLHRDIKEENILIDRHNLRIWLIDLGSATFMSKGHLDKYNGTVAYSPPEWIKFRKYQGCQLESWSLGIILYGMLCGCVPYEDEEQILRETSLMGPFQIHYPRRDLSKESRDLIRLCLDPDPQSRIGPQEMLNHKWITNFITKFNCDSGRGSFDDGYMDTNTAKSSSSSMSKDIIHLDFSHCFCRCLNFSINDNNENEDESKKLSVNNSGIAPNNNGTSAIETIPYNWSILKTMEPDWDFRVISRSFSPDRASKSHLNNRESIEYETNNQNLYRPSIHKISFDRFNSVPAVSNDTKCSIKFTLDFDDNDDGVDINENDDDFYNGFGFDNSMNMDVNTQFDIDC